MNSGIMRGTYGTYGTYGLRLRGLRRLRGGLRGPRRLLPPNTENDYDEGSE